MIDSLLDGRGIRKDVLLCFHDSNSNQHHHCKKNESVPRNDDDDDDDDAPIIAATKNHKNTMAATTEEAKKNINSDDMEEDPSSSGPIIRKGKDEVEDEGKNDHQNKKKNPIHWQSSSFVSSASFQNPNHQVGTHHHYHPDPNDSHQRPAFEFQNDFALISFHQFRTDDDTMDRHPAFHPPPTTMTMTALDFSNYRRNEDDDPGPDHDDTDTDPKNKNKDKDKHKDSQMMMEHNHYCSTTATNETTTTTTPPRPSSSRSHHRHSEEEVEVEVEEMLWSAVASNLLSSSTSSQQPGDDEDTGEDDNDKNNHKDGMHAPHPSSSNTHDQPNHSASTTANIINNLEPLPAFLPAEPITITHSSSSLSSSLLQLTGRPPICLYLSPDHDSLSSFQVLIRQNVEFFEAQETDVQHYNHRQQQDQLEPQLRPKGCTASSITLGQVGIRCCFCASLLLDHSTTDTTPTTHATAVQFPTSRRAIYDAVQWIVTHHWQQPQPQRPSTDPQYHTNTNETTMTPWPDSRSRHDNDNSINSRSSRSSRQHHHHRSNRCPCLPRRFRRDLQAHQQRQERKRQEQLQQQQQQERHLYGETTTTTIAYFGGSTSGGGEWHRSIRTSDKKNQTNKTKKRRLSTSHTNSNSTSSSTSSAASRTTEDRWTLSQKKIWANRALALGIYDHRDPLPPPPPSSTHPQDPNTVASKPTATSRPMVFHDERNTTTTTDRLAVSETKGDWRRPKGLRFAPTINAFGFPMDDDDDDYDVVEDGSDNDTAEEEVWDPQQRYHKQHHPAEKEATEAPNQKKYKETVEL